MGAATWTDERTDKLRMMVADGYSASEIARSLGWVSRNAVIGKVNRLGLQLGSSPASSPRSRTMREVADGTFVPKTPKPYHANRAAAPKAKPPKAAKPVLTLVVPPTPQPAPEPSSEFAKPFADRGRGECWWPIGEGAAMQSCCAKVKRGGLCEAHAVRGYQPPSTDADRKRAASSFIYYAKVGQGGGFNKNRGFAE